MNNIEQLLTNPITWKNHPTHIRYFFTEFHNQIVLLRLNDFPDEPLLTMIYGMEILDIEERPVEWFIPFKTMGK
jgi:hypothetical protein